MKTKHLILTASFLLFSATALMAQVPPPPPSSHGLDGNQPAGGGAPIGSGIAILLSLGAAYGGKKVYDFHKKKLED